jgi:hypothetical protein
MLALAPSSLRCNSFRSRDEVVPFSDQVLLRIADPVAVDLDPGTVGLPGLAHEVGNEPALTGQFP